jgi:response regulator RpfG family c-di-GMP phosphodiesterase
MVMAGIVETEAVGMSPIIKIICVDDDISILQIVKDCLCEHFLVAIAGSALKGLDLMETDGPFDIVMSDHEMPGMTGLEFLSLVAERWPETFRILMSGCCMDMDSVTRAINAGHISRFMPKPFDAVILADQLLEEFNGGAEPVKQE